MAPNNPLSTWGNEKTMNLNPLILTNIQSSPYFKVNLYELKTYHEVIDEIYYKVSHLEPWEKGSRKTAGQTGMCGGVRGVGAGGIVSSAYCLLYKLFTLKLTRKQVIGLLTHVDSPYIRGLGFMYIRYTQPPQDLWTWFEEYLDDDEEVDVKAGGGCVMAIGEMLRQWLTKLEWFSTLFPRIPVPVQKAIDVKMREIPPFQRQTEPEAEHIPDETVSFGEAEKHSGRPQHSPESDGRSNKSGRRSPPIRRPSPDVRRSPERRRNSPNRRRHSPESRSTRDHRRPSPERKRSPDRRRHSPERRRQSPSRRRHSPDHRRSSPRRSPQRRASPGRSSSDFSRELAREKERQRREKDGGGHVDGRERRRSRSRERSHRESERRSKHTSRSTSRDRRKDKSRHSHHAHRHRNGDH